MTTGLVKARYSDIELGELMQSPVTVLNGVSEETAALLGELLVTSVLDLAMSPTFMVAVALSFPEAAAPALEAHGFVPTQFVDPHHLTGLERDEWRRIPVGRIRGISQQRAMDLHRVAGIETVLDLATWRPFVAAQELAGNRLPGAPDLVDPGVPPELVPRFNDHASEKSFYSVYVVDPPPGNRRLHELKEAVPLTDLAAASRAFNAMPRTGHILRYEQAWIPTALTMGNLLHSLALAPGESTRIAMIDWSRRQGVSTAEDVSQLESLANTMMQTRSINEITRAVAREAQSGFSSMNANSTVSNNAYSGYGIQNPVETLIAGGIGTAAGGAVGAVAGGQAGGMIGTVGGAGIGAGIGLAGYGAGAAPGAVIGAAIGSVAGGIIGVPAGALVGGTSGGVGAALAAAQFGADTQSGSQTMLESVTTTTSQGTREIEAEMAQTINDRTQQHASSSRNRRASIVQEVTESESEKISTRVVTNYNHMHALTIQYFEVVQAYTVRTTLVGKQPCLYVPVAPITKWTPELIRTLRDDLVRAALSAEVAYSLATTPDTVALTSPRYARVPGDRLSADAPSNLTAARASLDAFVSADPYDGWTIPDDLRLVEVWPTAANGDGPLANSFPNANYKVWLHTLDGKKVEYVGWTVDYDDAVAVEDIAAITYEITEPVNAEESLADLVTQVEYGWMRLAFSDGENEYVNFISHFSYGPADIDGRTLTIPLLMTNRAIAMAKLLDHLNANTEHYSARLMRRRNSPLVRRLLTNYKYKDKPLLGLVDPEPVAVTGNDLIFVLRDESLVSSTGPDVGTIVESEVVPVATGGVFAEAIQGRANSAELLDISRFWNWQDSPIPILPPDIAPIQSGSRSLGPGLVPGGLDGALVSPMTPAALPAPTGMPAVLNALTADLFRDMSGVEETARAAETALEQAMSGAVATGSQAAESLEQGMAMTKDVVGKIVEMNSKFAGKIVDAGVAAMGTAGSAVGGFGGLGGGAATAVGRATGAGSTSTGGAILNEAVKQSARRKALRQGAGTSRGVGSGPGVSAGNTGSGSSAADAGSARSNGGGPDLVDQAMQWLMGVPDSAGSLLGQLSKLRDLVPEFDLGKLFSWRDSEDVAATKAELPDWKPDLDPSLYTGPGQASQAPALEIYAELMANAQLRHIVNSSTAASGALPGPDQTRPIFEQWFNEGVAPLLVYARHNDAYVNSAMRQYVRWAESIHLTSDPNLIDQLQGAADARALIGVGLDNAIKEANSRMEANNDLGYLEDVARWVEKAHQFGLADDPRFDLSAVIGGGPLQIVLTEPIVPLDLPVDQQADVHISGGLAIGVNAPLEQAVVTVTIEVENGSASPSSGQINAKSGLVSSIRREGNGQLTLTVTGEATVLGALPVRGAVATTIPAL